MRKARQRAQPEPRALRRQEPEGSSEETGGGGGTETGAGESRKVKAGGREDPEAPEWFRLAQDPSTP